MKKEYEGDLEKEKKQLHLDHVHLKKDLALESQKNKKMMEK